VAGVIELVVSFSHLVILDIYWMSQKSSPWRFFANFLDTAGNYIKISHVFYVSLRNKSWYDFNEFCNFAIFAINENLFVIDIGHVVGSIE